MWYFEGFNTCHRRRWNQDCEQRNWLGWYHCWEFIVCAMSKLETLMFSANNKEFNFWWIDEKLLVSSSSSRRNWQWKWGWAFQEIEHNSLKWKRCTAGYHQRTNDIVYFREFLEIIEPRGTVSRVNSSGQKTELWGTPQERVEDAEMESLIETVSVWERDER